MYTIYNYTKHNISKRMLQEIFDIVEEFVEKVKKPVYIGALTTLHLLYALVFFGFITYNSVSVERIDILIQLFICFFLMFRFNPFRKHELKQFDGEIIFGSALFLLANLGFTQYFEHYFVKTRDLILQKAQQ